MKHPFNITILGTLPPLKGMSEVCSEQVKALLDVDSTLNVQFIDFLKLYPESLYPGGTTVKGWSPPLHARLLHQRILKWYSPLSWLKAGLQVSSPVLHVHWWTYYLFFPKYFTVVFARLRGVKVVVSIHNVLGHETNLLDRIMTTLIVSVADHCVVHASKNLEQFKQLYGFLKKPVSVISLGLSNYLIEPLPQSVARAQLDLPIDAKVILSFGNIRKYKGLEILLPAFSQYLKLNPKAILIIAGKPWVDWAPYGQLIEDLKIANSIRLYLDFIPNEKVKNYFSAADLLVLSYTHFEAVSGPGRIAVGYGLPMLVSNVGGLPELVDYNGHAIFKNQAELAEKMETILTSPNLQFELKKGASKVKELLGWNQIVLKQTAIYKTLTFKIK